MSEIAFASMAASMAAPVTEKGVKFLDQARTFMRERWKQTVGQFDIEKVFYQIVFGEVLLYVGRFVYIAYTVKILWEETPALAVAPVVGWWEMIPGIKTLEQIAEMIAGVEGGTLEAAEEAVGEMRRKALAKHGIPEFFDQLMNENFVYLQLAVLALPPFLEYRRVKKLKRLMM